jgi:hypothetical protein
MASTTILSDNGASSGSAGLKSTAGNDGVLILQTTTSGGTATNAVYVDNKQNVGIGSTTPVTWYSNRTKVLSVTGASGVATVNYANAVGESLYNFYFNSSAQSILQSDGYAGLFDFNNNAVGGWGFKISPSGSAGAAVTPVTVATINAYGIGVGTATPSSGTGITFPATQSASTDANTLDDYEEGTWTPLIIGTSGGTATSTSVSGSYTKVGRFVTMNFALQISSLTGVTGDVSIGGMPFTSASGSVNQFFNNPIYMLQMNIAPTATMVCQSAASSNSYIVYEDNNTTNVHAPLPITKIKVSTYIRGTLFMFV